MLHDIGYQRTLRGVEKVMNAFFTELYKWRRELRHLGEARNTGQNKLLELVEKLFKEKENIVRWADARPMITFEQLIHVWAPEAARTNAAEKVYQAFIIYRRSRG